jgi:dethiobiotin synthetase
MNYFVTAIGTDSGKTIASAILCEALNADYWKPVQAGTPKDSDTVRNLISNQQTIIHPEKFILNTPASPHAAAKIDGVTINVSDFQIPKSANPIIIEGAGGCLVPLNDHAFVIDLATHLKTEVIVIANLYLGSINHTLLTFEALTFRNLPIRGIIFNGEPNAESQNIILKHTKAPELLHIKREQSVTKSVIREYATMLRKNLQ